ncbi:MAG: DNA-directed RNA polymerase subunit omega [Candidatus Tectomicrobia bacterium]|uniref:DNA-directed RNA polymerase subunit omega n=1 Tax=Tectimicrobiota bacterium TaxID=2528274 RepID=A0A932CM27_UNCTE|nr:DNA-directed RNA polymerase subunit omega [Candidatus Tectomicrobia bacterium]
MEENGSYWTKAFKMIPNRFLLVKVAAERVQQLNKGAKPLVESDSEVMPLSEVALKEIAEGKIQIELPPPKARRGG